MFIKTQSAKIILNRRSSSVSPVATTWYNEIFYVTSEVCTNRKVVLQVIPVSGSESVMLNGLVLYRSVDWDYAVTVNEIIFSNDVVLTVGDTIRIKYQG